MVKLDPDGNPVWSRGFGAAEVDGGANGGASGGHIAVDGSGNVLVTGYFQGAVDFGGGELVSAGKNDVFLVKLGADGKHLWSKRYGDDNDQYGSAVAVDGSDRVLVTGYFMGKVDFNGGPLDSAGQNDIFVAKLDATGKHLWSKRYGDAADQWGSAIAVDSSGNELLTGSYNGTVDFGGGPLAAAEQNGRSAFVAKLAPDGKHVWSLGWATSSGSGIAVDGSDNMLVTGSGGSTGFGVTCLGGIGIPLVKLDAAGKVLWARCFGSANSAYGNGIAVEVAGNVLVTGRSSATADFGGGPLADQSSVVVFAAKFGH
ncbi:MAG: hypothetical protein HY744_32100 [Deltaproteobacteria bacterium]|nr:hypothetical protein [Deltaproteobacteria bacterium]